jgi:hypothetical protein
MTACRDAIRAVPVFPALAAIFLTVAVVVLAEQAPQLDLSKLTPNSVPVTMQSQGAQFSNVISTLGQVSGIHILFAPNVTLPKDPVTMEAVGATFEQVFKLLIAKTNLSYTVVDEKTVLITNK